MNKTLSDLALSARAHAPFLIGIGIYALLSWYITSADFVTGFLPFAFMILAFVLIIGLLKAIGLFFEMMFFAKPERPFKFWIAGVGEFLSLRANFIYGLPLLLGFYVFTVSFSGFKNYITIINPFAYDEFFHNIDVALHMGKMPWEILHRFFDHPFWASLLNINYHFWFFLIFYAFFISFFGRKSPELSIRYIIASLLLWAIVGNGLAMIFSSAGPCYYGLLELGADPYSPLMDRLRLIDEKYTPLMALDMQNLLWENYSNDESRLAQGISAFPSLHVASSVLLACAGFAYRPLVGWIMALFALLILLGSVYLAWHYAVDGYASVFFGVFAWYASKPLAKLYINRASYLKLNKTLK